MSSLVYPKSFVEAYNSFRELHPQVGEVAQIEIKDGPLWSFDPRSSIHYYASPEPLTLDDFDLEDYSHRPDPESYPPIHNLDRKKIRSGDRFLLFISPKEAFPGDAQYIARVRQLAEGIGDDGILTEFFRLPVEYSSQNLLRNILNRLTMPFKLARGMGALFSRQKEYQEAGDTELDGIFQTGWDADKRLLVSTGRLDRNFFLKYLSEIDEGRLPAQVNGIMEIGRKRMSIDLYRGEFRVSVCDYDAENKEDEEVFRKTVDFARKQ